MNERQQIPGDPAGRVPTKVDRMAALDAYEGLFCPHCEYPLTGLPDARCPECGEEFDPDELWARRMAEPMPVVPWCDRSKVGWVVAYVRTWTAVVVSPRRFALQFPYLPRQGDAWSFGVCSRGLACAIVLCWWLLRSREPLLLGALFAASVSVAVGSAMFELVFAGVCGQGCRPSRTAPLQNPVGWTRLVSFTCAFLPLLALAFVLADVSFLLPHPAGEILTAICIVTCLVHWLACLRVIVSSRSEPARRPAIALVGAFLGLFVGALFAIIGGGAAGLIAGGVGTLLSYLAQ